MFLPGTPARLLPTVLIRTAPDPDSSLPAILSATCSSTRLLRRPSSSVFSSVRPPPKKEKSSLPLSSFPTHHRRCLINKRDPFHGLARANWPIHTPIAYKLGGEQRSSFILRARPPPPPFRSRLLRNWIETPGNKRRVTRRAINPEISLPCPLVNYTDQRLELRPARINL